MCEEKLLNVLRNLNCSGYNLGSLVQTVKGKKMVAIYEVFQDNTFYLERDTLIFRGTQWECEDFIDSFETVDAYTGRLIPVYMVPA